MITKIGLINAILLAAAVFLGYNAYLTWTEKEITKTDPSPSSIAADWPEKKIVSRRMQPPTAYNVVSEKTLFSPDRKAYEAPAAVKSPEPVAEVRTVQVAGQTITLYGVILSGGFKSALVNNPAPKRGERHMKWVSVGDRIENLIVADIREQSIIIKDDTRLIEILLYDRSNPKSRTEVAKSSAPTVITTQPETQTIPKPRPSIPEKADQSEYETVVTPFGKITRKKN